MSPIEFRRELVQYACAALTGILANRSLTSSVTGKKDQACKAAWDYAQAMCEAAPSEPTLLEWRRQLEQASE